MNKSILLVVLPCVLAAAMVTANWQYPAYGGYPMNAGYGGYSSYAVQNRLYNAGNINTAQLQGARILNYLFGFLLLLDLTNATGNTISSGFGK